MKVGTAAVAVVALLAAFSAAPAQAQTITDVDILNFALNLEYLEASFYTWAVNGTNLPATLRGSGGGRAIGGQKANLTGEVLAYATEIATDEVNHVRFLRAALGSAAVAMPQLNIGSAFATAANAAFNTTLPAPFNPYANDLFFMHGAFIFEDVGVTAYKGAAALITTPAYLTAAAGILAVEAYHAGVVRNYLYQNANVTVEVYGVNVSTIVDNIAALRSSASGLPEDMPNDFGVIVNGTSRLVPTDANGIVYSRTPAQVISIVTLGGANGTGGFFPQGLNGNINATLAASDSVTVGDSTPAGMTPINVGTGAAAPAAAPSDDDSPAGTPEDSDSPAGTPEDAAAAGTPGAAPAPAPQSSVLGASMSAAALFAAAAAGATLLLA